jgi:hypothetical protein
MKHIFQTLLLLSVLSMANISYAQVKNFNAGAYIGAGEIKGNSPSITSLGLNLFFDFKTYFIKDVSFRFNFLYARKVEYFLPENSRGKYYPFISVLGLKAFIQQSLGGVFFIEEGTGIIVLHDRTFSDTDVWDLGTAFNILAGIDSRNLKSEGFTIGLGIEYGITFNNTTASYFLTYIQAQYHF